MQSSIESKPWWQFGHVWMVISGPVLVIVACLITAYFIMSSPNDLVTDETYQQIMESKKSQGNKILDNSDAPALQARNHAATGAVPIPK